MARTNLPWPGGDGEMAARLRAYDWAATPLGPVATWSERLRLMVEQVLASPHVASLVCGAHGTLIYNAAAAGLYGQRHPAALGRPLPETFPEGWATVAPFYARAFAGETVQVAGQPLDTRGEGGGTDVFDAVLTPVRETDGDVAYVHMTGFEVGKHRRAEAALRESDARHRLLIGSWAQAVWETDADGVVVADSPSWRAHTGQTLGEWLGYGWLDAIHPDDRAYAERQWREAMAARGRVNAEFRLRAPDGGWRWTNVRAAPVLDAGGHIEKWAGMNIDIDVRKRAETALRASEERYHTLFEAMDEAYAVVEVLKDEAGAWTDFRFLDVNPAFMTHTSMPWPVGQTATELLGRPNPRWTQLYGQALDTGEPIRVEEGEPTLHRVFDLNIFSLDRERNRVAVLFTDITERVRAEAALRGSEERQAFLLTLSDALRSLSDPVQIQTVTGRLLGRHLAVDRCAYGEIDETTRFVTVHEDYHVPGLASVAGRHRIENYGSGMPELLRRGQAFLLEDARLDPASSDATIQSVSAAMEVRAAVVLPLMRSARPVALLTLQQSRPRAWTRSELQLIQDVADRTGAAVERARAEAALRESEERFAQFAASSSDGLWIRDAGTLAMEYTSPAIQRIYGISPGAILGDRQRWAALVVPEDRETAIAHLDEARTGARITHEFRIRRSNDGALRWIRNTDFPLRDRHGRVQRIGGLAEDVTEAREMRERQGVLIAELQHRTRNLMGAVRSMTHTTLRRSTDLADFQTRFGDRLSALARVQGLLSRLDEGQRITFDALIQAEMAALDGSARKVTLTGPTGVALRSSTVQTFALALHELATNAVKYGAFAQPLGRLDIGWRLERAEAGGRPWLHVDWRERGVAMPAAAPAAPGGGSGRELIERALPYQLGAKTTYVMEADGVHCTIALPVSERQSETERTDA